MVVENIYNDKWNICRTNRGISHILALGFEHKIILVEHESTIRQTIWINAFIVFWGSVNEFITWSHIQH
jgi:hypothetical protein